MTAQRSDESGAYQQGKESGRFEALVEEHTKKIEVLFTARNDHADRIKELETQGDHMATQIAATNAEVDSMKKSAQNVAESVHTMKHILVWIAGIATIAIGAVVVKFLGAS